MNKKMIYLSLDTEEKAGYWNKNTQKDFSNTI